MGTKGSSAAPASAATLRVSKGSRLMAKACATSSLERADVPDHAEGGGETDEQQDQGHDEHQ